MIIIPNITGKTIGVVGLGKSGRATVASLLASGANIIAWDDGEAGRIAAQKEFPDIAISPVEEWNVASLESLVMSPGIFLSHPAVLAAQTHGVEVIGDIELLYRAQPKARYVCITGTNGKSTTTTLIAHILNACGKRVEVGGNLGTPALALAPLDADGFYVLELSSYQLDLVRTTHFQTALLLNISPDHLDHHGSMENYVAAKKHIFERMEKADVAIIGVDDGWSESIAREVIASKRQCVIPISGQQSIHNGVFVTKGVLNNHFGLREVTGDIRAVKSLRGAHNGQNAAASYAACLVNGCTHEAIIATMQTYAGLAHRMQWLGDIAGVQFVNDSKATNADAAEKALLTYDSIYWIIGGVAKEGGIEPLAKYFPKVRHAYLIGGAADDFAKTLDGHVRYTHCGTLENAFAAASCDALRDGIKHAVVLLSPACASFDQFANFEVRGEMFAALFEALKAGGTNAATA